MKKLNKIFLCISTVVLLSSCEGLFDFIPDGRFSYDDVFSDNNQMSGYLNTAYTYIPMFGMSYPNTNFLSVYSDESQDTKDVDNSVALSYYNGDMTISDNKIDNSLYNDMYIGIRKCNVFIDHIDDATGIYVKTDRSKWRGEAHILRAFYYLQLIKRFGPVPIILHDTEIYNIKDFVRPTFYENVQQIIEDCDSALTEPDLPWRNIQESERGAMTKSVACAIKSQAILFAASPLWNEGQNHWAEAAEITKAALDSLRNHNYALYNPGTSTIKAYGNYQRYFLLKPEMVELPGTDKETIYAQKTQLNVWQQHGLPMIPNTLKAGDSPSQELVDAYETTDGKPVLNLANPYSDADHLVPNYNVDNILYNQNDPYANRDQRFLSSIYCNGVFYNLGYNMNSVYTYVGGNCGISTDNNKYTRTGYYIRKWVDYGSINNANKDGYWRYYRFAEILLNFAEAEFYANGVTGDALNAINEVRNRAGLPGLSSTISATEFVQRLRNERRVEFAFEEHRYFDVRRWKVHNLTDGIVTGMRITMTAPDTYIYDRVVVSRRQVTADKYLMWPIPYTETTKFDMQGIDYQNPGW